MSERYRVILVDKGHESIKLVSDLMVALKPIELTKARDVVFVGQTPFVLLDGVDAETAEHAASHLRHSGAVVTVEPSDYPEPMIFHHRPEFDRPRSCLRALFPWFFRREKGV